MKLLKKLSQKKEHDQIHALDFSENENSILNQVNNLFPRLKTLIKESFQPKPKLLPNDYFWCDRVFHDIEILKGHLLELNNYRRKNQKEFRLQIIDHIKLDLEMLKEDYSFFLEYSKPVNPVHNYSESYIKLRNAYVAEMNKDVNYEFGRIYYHFKRTAKSLDDIPMKQILKQMRDAFGFDKSKTTSNIQTNKYYDANSMEIR